ncbi:hypothetical protein SAMN02910291_01821 [Desulfovibrio desulfuricans]|uniref:Uncharacterized protein n=1 Tax=Desulfovibrio desulfuricans TaxID=876 RepID=A0AA94HU54_DESDE|nr:hypothetical protein SAMN02910291_01821 [Desulfovibrio desulfuricans]SPD35098.1 Hypothetical protein DSVG11_0993 [Desulfovibrio sp. G11]
MVDACVRLAWAHRATLRWWALENPSWYDKIAKGETLVLLRPASSWGRCPRPDEPAARIDSSAGALLRKT